MAARELFLVEAIARVCHEANRAWCATIGDHSQPPWDQAPAWQCDSALHGVKAHLEALRAGRPLEPSASHELWLAEKREQGWRWGPVKDPDKKEHPCFVPYDRLPEEQRIKDALFGAIVAAFFRATLSPLHASAIAIQP